MKFSFLCSTRLIQRFGAVCLVAIVEVQQLLGFSHIFCGEVVRCYLPTNMIFFGG